MTVATELPATCRTFDPDTGGGEVVLDDGTVLAFDAGAWQATPIRFLRPGQRLRVRVSGDARAAGARVTRLTLAGLELPGG
jgi:2-phospho-L-lactate guanylyltransferase